MSPQLQNLLSCFNFQEEFTKQAAKYASFPPPEHLENTTLSLSPVSGSCNCKQILISSLGDAQRIQHGKYIDTYILDTLPSKSIS